MAEAPDKSLEKSLEQSKVSTPLEDALAGKWATPQEETQQPDNLPSLRQFLSQHLQQRENIAPLPQAAPAATESTTLTEKESFSVMLSPFEVFARGDRLTEQTGQQLNQLDTEMAAGLEHMLPTPSFRFKVMRNRIANETMILEAKLAQYRNILDPPAGLQAKIATLEQRLETLKHHDAEIAFKQAAITVRPPVWIRLLKTFQAWAKQGAKWLGKALSKTLAACSPLTVARNSNPMQRQLVQINQQLTNLADVLDTELNEPGTGGAMSDLEDVSRMLRQYEQLVRRGNRLGQVLGNRPGLMDKANDWLQRHVRHWLTYWQG